MSSSSIDDIDDVIHQRVRLGVLALLSQVQAVEFTRIRDELGTSDGNLSRHLTALTDAGYVSQDKTTGRGKPVTWVEITPAGREALAREAAALRKLLGHLDD